jgi:RHS repeat-associated protein
MDNRFLFKGAFFVPGPDIYDMRNRFYHPNMGRFMQSDPIGFDAGDMNLFRYCGDDPVNHTDPTGLQDDKPNLTMWGGRDWVKGSDGLDAWDRTAGGMPSNRWEAGESGAGGGDRSSPRGQTAKQKAAGFPTVDPDAVLKAAQIRQSEIQNAVRASEHTPDGIEYKAQVHETRQGALITTKMYEGDGTQPIPGENRIAQRTTISNTNPDFLLVGYIVGYAHYKSTEARHDVKGAAGNSIIAAAIFVGIYQGKMTPINYVRGEPLPKIPGLGYPY